MHNNKNSESNTNDSIEETVEISIMESTLRNECEKNYALVEPTLVLGSISHRQINERRSQPPPSQTALKDKCSTSLHYSV
jgi:hypothetical protein